MTKLGLITGMTCVCLLAACGGPPPTVDPAKLQARTLGTRSVALPGGWQVAEDTDGSVKITASEKDIVLNAAALAASMSVLTEAGGRRMTKLGMERLGGTDVNPLPKIAASPGVIYCSKGTAGVNVVVLCFHNTGTLRSGDPMPTVFFQGTAAGWARTGTAFLKAVLESMKGFKAIR